MNVVIVGAGPAGISVAERLRELDEEAVARPSPEQLSRREREIMDAVYRLGEAPAAEVAAEMKDEDAFDSIRVTLVGPGGKEVTTESNVDAKQVAAAVSKAQARQGTPSNRVRCVLTRRPSPNPK